jgi:hypothetical protein
MASQFRAGITAHWLGRSMFEIALRVFALMSPLRRKACADVGAD